MTTDHGTRCSDHVGEAFRPRCAECDAAAETTAPAPAAAARPAPVDHGPSDAYGNCTLHPHYPTWPSGCDRCARDRDAAALLTGEHAAHGPIEGTA